MHDYIGNLCIGSEKGLCRYDYETDKFITYKKEAKTDVILKYYQKYKNR